MMFAAIFIPDFPVAAVVRAEPELHQRAVVIVEGTPPLLHVVAGNERARTAGVELGMTQLEAEGRLTTRFPTSPSDATVVGWCIRRRSTTQETAAHAALLDCACAFSPRMEDQAADLVVLDISGLDRLFGSPAKIARELTQHTSKLGLAGNIGVAASIETAVHAARGFSGITLIPPGQELARLGVLPVEVLLDGNPGPSRRVPAKGGMAAGKPAREILDTLARWGVRTFLALAALPESAVHQRLGEAGVQLQRLARGEGSRPLVPTEPPLRFNEAAELEDSVALLEPLAFLLNHMVEQLCARLAGRALATQELRLRLDLAAVNDSGLGFSDFPETAGSLNPKSEIPNPQFQKYVLRLPVPMLDPKVFLKLLQLELQTRPPGAPVKKIFLAVEPVAPRFTQGGLFLPAAPEPEKLELTLARISSIVSGFQFPFSRKPNVQSNGNRTPETGNSLVGVAELLDTHRPDAFRIKKFSAAVPSFQCPKQPPPDRSKTGSDSDKDRPSPTAPGNTGNWSLEPRSSPARITLRRFRPPQPVEVKVENGRPKTVISGQWSVARKNNEASAIGNCKPETGNCLWAGGPWRESGEWWTEQVWSREIWDVAVRHGSDIVLYRIFRDTIRDQWFVEASYD
jgi:protein ImuB